MENLFDLQMIASYSWSGVSKNKSVPKKRGFKLNRNIVTFIHDVLRLADCTWTEVKNENKLQAYLKHPKFNRQNTKEESEHGSASPSPMPDKNTISNAAAKPQVIVHGEIVVEQDEIFMAEIDLDSFTDISGER